MTMNLEFLLALQQTSRKRVERKVDVSTMTFMVKVTPCSVVNIPQNFKGPTVFFFRVDE
jgi:hypothetical protein